jgi:Ca-activated chloride channel family protein
MVAELALLGAALLAGVAEVLHARRIRRMARLAFGPSGRPAPWALAAPGLRVAAVAALAWGLFTLMSVQPMVYAAEELPLNERRHLLIVLDVSPSMNLVDAGAEKAKDKKVSRRKRAADLMHSLFRRVPVQQYLMTVVACYNGAKPVVEDTKDMEVVRNILDDLPMQYAFPAGKTDLFAGLAEAARIAQSWNPRSTLLVLLSDGDTVPATGMPKLPASISGVLVVGVGDPRQGSFVDGRMSRQDASTLRQIAARLRGFYHDGNEKHLPSDVLAELTMTPKESPFEKLTRREYALIASGAGAAILAFLPVLLHYAGTRWRPGVPEARLRAAGESRESPSRPARAMASSGASDR